MTKTEAIALFGTLRATAEAMGLSTQAVYAWPDPLTKELQDKVLATLLRTGRGAEAKRIAEAL